MGVPPTDLNARTGEFTPPGNRVFALANNDSEFLKSMRILFIFFKVFFLPDKIFQQRYLVLGSKKIVGLKSIL